MLLNNKMRFKYSSVEYVRIMEKDIDAILLQKLW